MESLSSPPPTPQIGVHAGTRTHAHAAPETCSVQSPQAQGRALVSSGQVKRASDSLQQSSPVHVETFFNKRIWKKDIWEDKEEEEEGEEKGEEEEPKALL